MDKVEKAKLEYERVRAEVEHFKKWIERERAKGRPEHELTFGNCVRETGVVRRDGLRSQ